MTPLRKEASLVMCYLLFHAPTVEQGIEAIKKAFPYRYVWKNNEKRRELYGRMCRVLVRGIANSALVEFAGGQREVVSRNALRRTSA